MSENIIAASWRIGKSSEDKVGHCCTGRCEELWKKDATLSFIYVALAVGQDPWADGNTKFPSVEL